MSDTKTPQSNLLLRAIDPTIADAFRDRCREEGRTQRWTAMELIKYYNEHGLPIAPSRKAK